ERVKCEIKWSKRFLTGESHRAPLPRRGPIFDRPFRVTRLCPVMSDEFRHLACDLGMRSAQSVGDMLVQLLASAPQHALIRRIAKQLVSELVLDRSGITRFVD